MRKTVLIAVGANKNNPQGFHPLKTCELAINSIHQNNVKILKKSSWYFSKSLPKSNQPNYFNCVVECETCLKEDKLLQLLNKTENALGRIRGKKNIARCIDLDIIDYSSKIKRNLKLTLPHPRAHLRKFVILPISEINPNWIHPLFKKNIKYILERCGHQIIKRIKKNIDFK